MASSCLKYNVLIEASNENYDHLLGFIGFIYKYGLDESFNSIVVICGDLSDEALNYLERFQLIKTFRYDSEHNTPHLSSGLEEFREFVSLVVDHFEDKCSPLIIMFPPYYFFHPIGLIQADLDVMLVVASENKIGFDQPPSEDCLSNFLTLIFVNSSLSKIIPERVVTQTPLIGNAVNNINWKQSCLSWLLRGSNLKVRLFSVSQLSLAFGGGEGDTSPSNKRKDPKPEVSRVEANIFNASDKPFNSGQYIDHLEYQRHRIKTLYSLPNPIQRDQVLIRHFKEKFSNLPCRTDRFVFCDGGLSNRIYSLLYPLCGGRLDRGLPIVYWPPTQVCAARFDSLFDTELKVIEDLPSSFRLVQDKEDGSELKLITHQSISTIPALVQLNSNELSESAYNSLWCDSEGICVYNNNALPPFFDVESRLNEIGDALMTFGPKPDLIESAASFFASISNNNNVIGLHIRGTDFNPDPSFLESLMSMVKANPTSNFFMCTDDREIKARFDNLKNVYSRNHISFVDYDRTTGGIFRSSDSVRDALIDLLVLSRCNIISTSNSSFLQFAKILRSLRNLNTAFGW